MQLFDSLIKSGMLYGAEIWGWKEREQLEAVQRKYIKWTLGLPVQTRTATLMMETGRMPLAMEATCKAMKYEIKIQEGKNPYLKEALRIHREDEERKALFEKAGVPEEEERRRWIFDRRGWLETCEVIRQLALQEIIENVDEEYHRIRTTHLPLYLEEGKNIKMIARFRCGSEERGREGWREKNDRMCRLCGTEEETIDHMITTCCPSNMDIEEILHEDGRGADWMRQLLEGREPQGGAM
jgi:hypothetical protein